MTEKKTKEPIVEAVEKKAPKKVVSYAIRCDYCRVHHSTVFEPGSVGQTILSLHEAGLLETEIPLDKLITENALCPGCGTKVPMRIRTDGTTSFITRQAVKAKK